MNRFILTQAIVVAADAQKRVTWAPPDSSRKWKLLGCGFTPNVASAANDTNYASIRPFKDTSSPTALAAARVTTTAGGALAQGTPVNFSLTDGEHSSNREITQTDPLYMDFDCATNGTGVAVEASAWAEFEEIRA